MKKTYLKLSLILVATSVLSFLGGSIRTVREYERRQQPRDTLIIHDTLRYPQPVAVSEKTVGTIPFRMAFFSLPDSLSTDEPSDFPADTVVQLPKTQRYYEQPSYQAWVSGFEPVLDSINVFQDTKYVPVYMTQPAKPKRWNVSVSGGYGFTKDGLSPIVGLTVGFSLFSF